MGINYEKKDAFQKWIGGAIEQIQSEKFDLAFYISFGGAVGLVAAAHGYSSEWSVLLAGVSGGALHALLQVLAQRKASNQR